MNTKQIAEEAAEKIGEILFELHPRYPNRDAVSAIIQVATERAYDEGYDRGFDKGYLADESS